ncbi:ATP-binding protein [Sphingobacterium hungaricum]|uniref:histidine kinase n=1 Tax=Sphingobacterium hungaricum TaxID=2082723 RepID=A0A928UUD6_9SPHI|nr:ATP-binding protein [Sphingobacterium hungaricum]MBE8713521.1 histidine kinase [Sphingobacterium hungaricum]
MGNKIRILLLILTASFLVTALTIHNIINYDDMLTLDTQTLTENLHAKETTINDIFNDSILMKTFENVDRYPTQVLDYTQELVKEYGIYLYIYKNHTPVFWSSNLMVPRTDLGLKFQTSYLDMDNRSFVAKKKEISPEVTVLALIHIKRNFTATNEYLNNKFSTKLIDNDNLALANYADTDNIRNIYSTDGTYLFSVKLKDGKHNNIYLNIQFACIILAMFTFLILANNVCMMLARKGKPILSIVIFGLILLLLRYIDLKINWLSINSSLGIFDPKYYAYNFWLPNLWAFLMASISLFWFVCYITSIQSYIQVPKKLSDRKVFIPIAVLVLFSIYGFSYLLFKYLSTLAIYTSNYNQDFTKILDLNLYSWINVFILCLNVLLLILFIDNAVNFLKKLINNLTLSLNLQLIVLILVITLVISLDLNPLSYFLLGVLIMLISFSFYKSKAYKLSRFIFTILLISIIASLNYFDSMRLKKIENMKLVLSNLEAEDDLNALSLFGEIETDIEDDKQLSQLFEISLPNTDTEYISNYLKNIYFSGYLSKFEFQAYYLYDGKPLDNSSTNKIEEYREKVINKSVKVANLNSFYRIQSELGTHEYFTQLELPIRDSTHTVQIFINLKNKTYSPTLPYPAILTDQKLEFLHSQSTFQNSFAMYKDGNLIMQNGDYTYPNSDKNFPKEVNTYESINNMDGYMHIMLRPNVHTTLLMSKPVPSLWDFIATVSFIFIVLYAFFSLFQGAKYIFNTVEQKSFKINSIKYHFLALKNQIQYSTRIQTLVVGTVLFAIMLTGIIAFVSINTQLEKTRETTRLKYISEIGKKIENYIVENETEVSASSVERILNSISGVNTTDFNLFNKEGRLIYTSQPRIYELELISNFINPVAFTSLNVLKKSDLIINEKVGTFEYDASYSAIKNSDYNIVAFLNVPYFSSRGEENASKNLLLNTLLNIYTIVMISFGFFAVIVSNKITRPLNIIGKKLSQTNIGKNSNDPLFWERDDEIGALIKEYNYMLVKLEKNAEQLMNAERESAWREMAKQVAHEIKNPLTPMKLGIQQLERSFDENDPRFKERFKKVANSFIEQINSLTLIANEFSNFAKMPETELMEINLLEKINKATILYSNSNVDIKIYNETNKNGVIVIGDRDQLLRTFNNLIKNSIEAEVGKRKKRVRIYVSIIDEHNVQVLLEDNGMGISDELLPKIFQPNFTTKSSGTGLGLAFVKKTIESMDGTITFETKPNIGTTFIMVLPYERLV